MNDTVTQYSICYRPHTWEEVYGQDLTVRELRNRVLKKNFPKVSLFQGPYGTGKTTLAHIFAACMQASLPDGNPDWDYPTNKSILNETFLGDTTVLDGSQIGGKTDIVDFSKSLSFKPMRDKYRIVIIEEADQLIKSAENALLKVLENPDPNVRFILLSMEQNGISNAIKSRCQIFKIKPLGIKDMMLAMKNVMEKTGDWENPDIPDEFKLEGLKSIAEASDGSLRTAFQNLEKCISGKIYDLSEIKNVMGINGLEPAYVLLREILNTPESEKLWKDLSNVTESMGFITYCMKVVQSAMLYKLSGVCLNPRFMDSTRELAANPNLEILYDTLVHDPLTFKQGLSTLEMNCLFLNYLKAVKARKQVADGYSNLVKLTEQVPATASTAPVQRRVVRRVATSQ